MARPGDHKDFGALYKAEPSLSPQSVTGSADQQGASVDAEGALGVEMMVFHGTPATGTDSAFYLEESEDGSSGWSKVSGSDLVLSSADSSKRFFYNAEVGDGHYRVVYDSGNSDADVEICAEIRCKKLEGLASDDS